MLTGEGRGFCSGQNLKASEALGSDIVAGVMRLYWPAFPALRRMPGAKHSLWTAEMCDTFHNWLLNGCPKGTVSPPNPVHPTNATWDNTIKNYFLAGDVTCMAGSFDLSRKSGCCETRPCNSRGDVERPHAEANGALHPG